jgi:hypothetical protein
MARRRLWFVAVVLAFGAVVGTLTRSPAPVAGARALADRFPLTAGGIGPAAFGQRIAVVVRRIETVFGVPDAATPKDPLGFQGGLFCGYRIVVWTGLAARPAGANTDGLTLYARRGRFAGYAYGPPYGDRMVTPVRHGAMLVSDRGLGLDEPLSRAAGLYGAAFAATAITQGTPPRPDLPLLPGWVADTPDGVMFGYAATARGDRGRMTVGSISAGTVPNTPCA